MGVKDNGAGGKPQGGSQARASFKAATGQCREGKKVKESRRFFPGEEVEEGELLGTARNEKVQKFGWGRGEKEELKGWSVRRQRHRSFPEGRRQRRQRRERREEPAGNPLGNQPDGTEGRRGGAEAAWAGRYAARRTHSYG